MTLLAIYALASFLGYYETKLSMVSPLIPDHIVQKVAQPYLTHAIFIAVAVALSLLFFFSSKYMVSIGICVMAIVIAPYLKKVIGYF
jgi:hypothetical protein